MKYFLFCCLLLSHIAYAKSVSSIAIAPQGSVLQAGSSLQFTVTCTYDDNSTDACQAAGGASWSSPTKAVSVSSTGVATWGAAYDPANEKLYPNGAFTAQGFVIVSAGGKTDRGNILAQHPSDTFYPYMTPDTNFYKDSEGNQLPLKVVVGAQPQFGIGFVYNEARAGYKTGVPGQPACNWISSDTSKATIDRYGAVTAIAPGNVMMTCGFAGNGVYGKAVAKNWVAPGNTITLEIVPGGMGSTTWYVRPKGGTIAQCDGKHDADYPGSGKNKPCAVGMIRDLWADGVSVHVLRWIISGGDTVIVRQTAPGVGYNMNLDEPSPYQTPAGKAWAPINCGGNPDCYMPTIPSGTSKQHTRILGENYANCPTSAQKTLLNVSYAGKYGISVVDSQYVDVQCFEISDKAACGGGSFTNSCKHGDQNFGVVGILQSALSSDVNFKDIFIHGLASTGVSGATGYYGVHYDHVDLRGMPQSGWNMDDAPWLSSNISIAGGIEMTNSITEWSGCIEEYPVVHKYPYLECRDSTTDSGEASPDGIGQGSTSGKWVFDNVIMRYNWQDGFDLLHSGMQYLSITNSQAYGNVGSAYKIGPADTVIMRNNIAVENCERLSEVVGDQPQSSIIPGATYCRGAGDWTGVGFTNQGTYLWQNNTFIGYGATPFDFGCAYGWDKCSSANAVFQNNILVGFSNKKHHDSQYPGLFYKESSDMPVFDGWSVRDHNLYYHLHCPSPLRRGEFCTDPHFVKTLPSSPLSAESDLDDFDFRLSGAGPAPAGGVVIPGFTPTGPGHPPTPSIGAMQYTGSGAAYIPEKDTFFAEWKNRFLEWTHQVFVYCIVLPAQWIASCCETLRSKTSRLYKALRNV